jgi:hypothetical protein
MAMTLRQHGFRFIGVAALGIGVCASMASSTMVRPPSNNFGHMVMAYELQRIHWKSMESPNAHKDQNGLTGLIDLIADGCIPEAVDYTWTVRFIPRSPGIKGFEGVKPDKVEEAAISAMKNGTGEVWQESSDGTWRLIAVLRTEKLCYDCHLEQSESAAVHRDNAPLGYASITLTQKVNSK